MPTFLARFSILLLLLPSSLGAVMASQELGAQMEIMASMSCCCGHDEAPEKSSGPVFSRACCCDVDLPRTPSSQEGPLRFAADENSNAGFVASESSHEQPSVPALQAEERIRPGAPRAPPRPLFLSFQSFLN